MSYILVVDDDLRIRTVIKKYFTSLGYVVDEAENGLIAVSIIKNAPKKYLLVIMDMMMPEMNGLEAFEEIRAAQIEVPVIMATAYGNLTLGVEFMKKGGADFVEKPLSLEVLALKVNQVLEKKKLREAVLSERILKQAVMEASQLKRDFLNKITHEFRTPIHAILNFSKFGMNNVSPEKHNAYFQNINQSGNKLLELIDELLSYAKMENDVTTFEFKRNDIVGVFQQALLEYREIRNDDKSDIILHNFPQTINTHFDGKRIKQTFYRILDNLYKFETTIKKVYIAYKESSLQIKQENSAAIVLPALRLCFGKFSNVVSQENIEQEIELFSAKYKSSSESMTDDFDLLLFENIIKAHRGEFSRIYVPGKGILFQVLLPMIGE